MATLLALSFGPLLTAVPLAQTGISTQNFQHYAAMAITNVVGGMLCFDLARRKNRHILLWTWLGFLVGPVAAIVLLFLPALPSRAAKDAA